MEATNKMVHAAVKQAAVEGAFSTHVLVYSYSSQFALVKRMLEKAMEEVEGGSFDEWFDEDDHDLYNYPIDAMREAYQKGFSDAESLKAAETEA